MSIWEGRNQIQSNFSLNISICVCHFCCIDLFTHRYLIQHFKLHLSSQLAWHNYWTPLASNPVTKTNKKNFFLLDVKFGIGFCS